MSSRWVKLYESDFMWGLDAIDLGILAYLRIHANTYPTKVVLNGKSTELPVGGLVIGLKASANALGLPKTTLMRRLRKLEKADRIRTSSGPEGTVVILCDDNGLQNATETTNEEMGEKRTASGPQADPLLELRIKNKKEYSSPNAALSGDQALGAEAGRTETSGLASAPTEGLTPGTVISPRQPDPPPVRPAAPPLTSPNSHFAASQPKPRKSAVKTPAFRRAYPEAFEALWRAYGCKGDKAQAFDLFAELKLTADEQTALQQAIAAYLAKNPERKYRKDFERFLKSDWRIHTASGTGLKSIGLVQSPGGAA